MKKYLQYTLFFCIIVFASQLLASTPLETYRTGYRSLISFSNNPYLPILLLMGVILAIATFYLPRFGLVVMLFFILFATDMPIGRNSNMQRSITIRIEDVILVLVSAGWLLNKAKTRSLAIVKYVPVYRPIMAMTIVIILATFIGYFQGTVSALRGFFFAMKRLEYFWIFFMTLNLMETDREAKIAIKILLGASIIIAFVGMVQFFIFPISELTAGGATATAGFGRANTMGDFLLMMTGIMVGFISYVKNPKQYIIYSIMLIIFILSLIMTKSRGAYVSVPPVLFVIFAVSKNKKAIMFLFIAAIFVLLYFFIISLGGKSFSLLVAKHQEEISEQFTQIADVATEGVDVDPSLHSRVKSWEESVDQIIDYPFFGQGCGSKKLGYSDNQYVRELLETGVIGFAVFIYMNLSIFLFMFATFRKTSDFFLKSLSLGFMGGQTGMMVHGITMSNFYTIFNMEIFWFILAIISLLWYNEYKRGTVSNQTIGETEGAQ